MLRAQSVTLGSRLAAVTAACQPGTITAICGPNGAGKSSLLQIMTGLLRPDSGEILLGAQPLTALHPRERAQRIGYLPQNGEVAWDVPVRTLVALGRLPFGDMHPAPIDAALAALDLDHLAARSVSQLSGGERARALLARVLAGEPEWILADEPLAALDLAHQMQLLTRLRAIADKGTGVVLVLHDLALAMNHADRVIVLDAGRIAADGVPQEALCAENIQRVWGVRAQWVGESRHCALQLAHLC